MNKSEKKLSSFLHHKHAYNITKVLQGTSIIEKAPNFSSVKGVYVSLLIDSFKYTRYKQKKKKLECKELIQFSFNGIPEPKLVWLLLYCLLLSSLKVRVENVVSGKCQDIHTDYRNREAAVDVSTTKLSLFTTMNYHDLDSVHTLILLCLCGTLKDT